MTYDIDDYAQNDNYKSWRKIHTDAFGDIFADAFADNEAARILLTAALINISQRRFETAMPNLEALSNMCSSEFDKAVVNYFKGLNYEMLQDEIAMTECYEKLRLADIYVDFPLLFHPYYRTAKFAQRDAECSKALYYYQKALAFYEDAERTSSKVAVASHIIYDIATVCLYMHRYDLAEKSLVLSQSYSSADDNHRRYVTAILYAVQGKNNASDTLMDDLPDCLQLSGRRLAQAIRSGNDLHYGIVPQDRTCHSDFVQWMLREQHRLYQLIKQGDIGDVETIISDKLTTTFPFMQKPLNCRIKTHNDIVIVKCKTYFVKTLKAEYTALFSMCRQVLNDWKFVPINEFEEYPLL